MFIVVASSSPYRQIAYRDALIGLGHRVEATGSGIDCVSLLRKQRPDLLILEAPLLWGGSDGVLEVVEQDLGPHAIPVIVLAVGSGSIDWFQLSRFKIDDFLFRVPTTQELGRAIESLAGQAAGMKRAKSAPPRSVQNRHQNVAIGGDLSSRISVAAKASSAAAVQ